MKEIKSIDLTRMNNGAHFLFITNVLERARADGSVSGRCAAQVEALDTAWRQEDENLKISQKSLLTDDIVTADRERDAVYSAYRRTVKGYLGVPVPEMAEAAKVLSQHIRDYGIDPKMQLDRETGLLLNFITDLREKYAPQVGRLGLTAFAEALAEANDRVRTLTSQRTDERTGKTIGALKAARSDCEEAYQTLVKFVNALALIEGEDAYAPFIAYVNTEIDHYRAEVISHPKTQDGGEA